MKWLNTLERKYGRFAISNLIFYIIGLNGIVYILSYFDQTGSLIPGLAFDLALILRGEIWRVVTFIFIPPVSSPLWIIFILYFYHMIGSSLEHEWGSFKFNVYYLIGMLATMLAACLSGASGSSVYLNLSLFLGFAYLFPDYEILLFFILPVKIKYLAWLDWLWLGFSIVVLPSYYKLAALASIVNFLVFFGSELLSRNKVRRSSFHNRKQFFEEIANTPPIHTCAVCGKTEKSHPRMYFSYCKICGDELKYCSEHLENHQHQTQEKN